jgi:transcriptional regulator with XRE-family HTH domain
MPVVVEKETNFSVEKMKKTMEELGWSQNFLAQMSGIAQSAVSYYLQGVKKPSKKTVQALAKALKVDYEDLIDTGEVEPITPLVEEKKSENEYQDILDVAQEMGNLRFKLIQMIQELDEGKFNAQDIDFLHAVENIEHIDNMTGEEALKMLMKAHYDRKNRRHCKERKYLIQLLLDGFLIKNPSIYITKVIERSKDWTYIPRVAEELKQDFDLYDTIKERRLVERKTTI